MPAAPPTFSITTGWPSRACRSAEAARMITSVTEPAAIDTIMRIGFVGYCCACAPAAKPASSNVRNARIRNCIVALQKSSCMLSFDHFVGAQYNPLGDAHADGLGGLEIDDQLEALRGLYRQIGRLGAVQDFLRD